MSLFQVFRPLKIASRSVLKNYVIRNVDWADRNFGDLKLGFD